VKKVTLLVIFFEIKIQKFKNSKKKIKNRKKMKKETKSPNDAR